MPTRLAASLALLAFVACLWAGGIEAGNPFATTVGRALQALVGTFAVALVVGWAGEKLVAESVPPDDAEETTDAAKEGR